jgi:hypothetical protein
LSRIWIGASLIVLFLTASAAQNKAAKAQTVCASPSFQKAVDVDAGLFASGIAVGDFNSDGNADMAVSNQNSNNVSILFGDGTGKFGARIDFPAGGSPQRITTSDLDHDGKLDLVLPIEARNAVSILMGDGKAVFSEPVVIPVEGGPFMPVVADFNSDGNLDLAVTTRTADSRKVAVLLGNRRGGFSSPTYYGSFANVPTALGVEDFNRDGKLDLAVGGGLNSPADRNNLSVLLGDGKGGFGAPAYFSVGPAPQSMSIADFNADGIWDIAISNSLAAGVNSSVSVLLGDGKGSFAERAVFEIGDAGRGTGVADFNGDGNLDLVVANSNSSTVSILLGDGKGSFAAKSDFAVGKNPRKLAVGDFNRDGRPDIATPNTGANNVSILMNNCTP